MTDIILLHMYLDILEEQGFITDRYREETLLSWELECNQYGDQDGFGDGFGYGFGTGDGGDLIQIFDGDGTGDGYIGDRSGCGFGDGVEGDGDGDGWNT